MANLNRAVKEFEQIQSILKEWDGACAKPCLYTVTHGALDLRLFRPSQKRTLCVLCAYTQFISAKVGWDDTKIRFIRGESDCLELVDPDANFRVVCRYAHVSEFEEYWWFVRSPYDP